MAHIGSLFARLLSAILVAAAVALLGIGMLGWLTDVAGPGAVALGPDAAAGSDDIASTEPPSGLTDAPPTERPGRTPRPFLPSFAPTVAAADPTDAPDPTEAADPTRAPETSAPDPTGTPDATVAPGPTPGAQVVTPDPTVAPDRTTSPTASPTRAPRRAVATRVVVVAMGIDLPVISRDRKVRDQGPDQYPPCDVALYHTAFEQPGEPGTTYLYAHARAGMFLPLLDASKRRNGRAMLGDLVQVYTSDDKQYVYRITRVKRHALDFSLAVDLDPGEQRLILQTSEGPRGTVPKLQIVAEPVEVLEASRKASRPRARPRACYDTP